jgi:hypothetical protein
VSGDLPPPSLPAENTRPRRSPWWRRRLWIVPIWVWAIVGLIVLVAVAGSLSDDTYRVSGHWAALDSVGDIIDNDGVYGPGELTLMVVPETASFVEISGEAMSIWEFPSYPVLTRDPVPVSGTYLVGGDIERGIYRVSDPDFAYAARLDNTLGISDNDGHPGSVVIVVQPGDFALSYSGTIERLS